MNEDGGGRSGHHYVLAKDVCVLKVAKDTQEINYGGSSNDTIVSDCSTPQFHATNDGSSVISNSIMYGVLVSSLRVTIYYILLCIRVCAILK